MNLLIYSWLMPNVLEAIIMKMSGAIFDLDGTLLDSMDMWSTVVSRYITSLRKTPAPDLDEKTKDMTLPVLANYLKDEYRIATTEDKIAKGFNVILREDYLASVDIKEYIPIYLEKLKQRGVALCVTTATDKAIAEEVLARLGIRDYFSYIITCEEAGCEKGDPEVFTKAHKIIDTPKAETIVFEDGLLAIKGAKKADFYVVALYDEYEDENSNEIKKLADRYITSFQELL